jgi:hypothetical protein
MLNEKECAIEEKEREIIQLKDENEKMKKHFHSSSSSPIPSLPSFPSKMTKLEGKQIKIKSFREECLTQKENNIECTTDPGIVDYVNFNIDHLISSVSSLFHSLSLILLIFDEGIWELFHFSFFSLSFFLLNNSQWNVPLGLPHVCLSFILLRSYAVI